MDSFRFSTRQLDPRDRRSAWEEWFQPVFDVHADDIDGSDFNADYVIWNLDGVSLTRVSTPGARTVRTSSHLRRCPLDHWVISYCQSEPAFIVLDDRELDARAGVPFVWSLAQVSESHRVASDRLQLYLPRDTFPDLAPFLDSAVGMMLDSGPGRLLAEYLQLLERNLPALTPVESAGLSAAVRAMVAACIVPSSDAMARALPQIKLTMLQNVRRAVAQGLHSPNLDPDRLCHDTAMSRSQLYRLLECEGGVARYIQRQRLSASYAQLCDRTNMQSIAEIAADFCFLDPSSFSRAFRREFGLAPTDVRALSQPGDPHQSPSRPPSARFLDCLRPH